MNLHSKKSSLVLLFLFVVISPASAQETGARGSSAVVLGSGGSNAGGESVQPDEFSGSATYSVTLPVPPARGGIEPQLILNYNSHRKNPNSWVGFGWELDLGSIERTTEPCEGDFSDCSVVDYYEGTHFQVRFAGQTESLEFQSSVDPADYSLTVSSDVRVDFYQAKIESSFNLYFHLVNTSGSYTTDEGWVVIDKGGRTYTFGASSNARESTSHCPAGEGWDCSTEQEWVARWLLESVEDPNGNTLTVSYDTDRLPAEISYQDITIEFNKQTDHYYYPTFRQGFLDDDQMGVYLGDIVVNQNGNRIQKYVFNYTEALHNNFFYLYSVTQRGSSDSEELPATTFEYYEGETPEWDSTAITRTASTSNPEGTTTGYLNQYTTLADMNGDGLVDLVASYQDQTTFYVYYNDGNDFVEVAGKSEWTEPFTITCWDDPERWCTGQINYYHVYGSINHQGAFLMDMNGDSLPDRVVGVWTTINEDYSQATFYIAFNNGQGGWGSYALWKDPYIGYWPGTSDGDKWFMDMNGDGLIDRVVSAQCDSMCHNDDAYDDEGFLVYYNTGTGFASSPVYWADPLGEYDVDNDGIGRLSADDDDKVYATIKDFNGDGLPDRIWRAALYVNGELDGYGFSVSLNRNGLEWAEPAVDTDGFSTPDGIDNLAIRDPVEDEDRAGYISYSKFDLMDMNADGYLDRVNGDTDNGRIDVYFYDGMNGANTFSSFSPVYEMADPVQNYSGEMDGAGYITRGEQDSYEIRHYHTFITDMNGDGYPDRVTLRPRDDDTLPKYYSIYPLRTEAIEFSDSPSDWDDPQINQPTGALKSVVDGQGNETAIEYLPSSWPQRWDVLNHKFLPFNLHLVHKVYALDYTMPASDTSVEVSRWPGMRPTTYNYWGGNLFVRYAERTDPSSSELLISGDLAKSYFLQFNGFQTVEKELDRATGETWDEFTTTTIYQQAEGDIDSGNDSYFTADAYGHFALSGKIFSTQIATTSQTFVLEENEYEVNVTDPSETFECDGVCFPKLDSVTKTVNEEGSTTSRISKVVYDYDDDTGNITSEKYYDRNNTLLLEKETTYYSENDLDPSLHLRDRPEVQSQQEGGTTYRYKDFAYDTGGNPTTERFEESGGVYATITRTFNSDGTLDTITDIDGVTKDVGYDSDGLFPVNESVTLPSGGTLLTTRDFDRLTGEVSSEENDQGVGKETVYDDFGRPEAEYIQASSGAQTLHREYSYEYGDYTVEDWGEIVLLKTQMWEPRDEYADTATNPAQIAYTDGSGNVLQKCSYTERGNYRQVQFRHYNGGRETYQTEPVFDGDCEFVTTISSSTKPYLTEKDIQGRPVYVEPPPGDTNSPTGNLTIAYSTNSDGEMVKTITTSTNLTKTETFDYNERLIIVTDDEGSTVAFDYNPVGDLDKVYSNGTLLVDIDYDLLGRKTQMWEANLGTWVYDYDSNGRLEKQTDNIGNYVSFDYDSLGRIERKEMYDSGGALEKYETYSYDNGNADHDVAEGELYEVEEYDSSSILLRSTKYGYDSDYRRIEKITRTIPDIGDLIQTLSHDFRGEVQSAAYPGGESLYYQYGRIGNLESFCNSSDCSSEIYYSVDPSTAYNEFGALQAETFGNGVTTNYTYYPLSHRLQEKKTASGGTIYSQRTFTFDEYANIKNITDALSSTGSGALSSVDYDNLQRMTGYTYSSASPSGATSTTLQYDSVGNITKNTAYSSSTYQYTSSRPHAVTTIGSDTFDYDDNGNMTSDPNRTMEYNANNQLKKVTMTNGMAVNYEYDYTGARVKKSSSREDTYHATQTSTTHYLGEAMEIKDNVLTFHIHVKDQRIATKSLGDVTTLLTATGSSFNPVFATINPRAGPIQALPMAMMGFMLFVMASFRPASLLSFWFSYTRSLHDALNLLHRNFALKFVALVLTFLTVVHIPLHLATAGDKGTPATSQSDENYFYYMHSDHLGSSHILTEGNSSGGKHSGILYPRGSLIQRIEYAPFGQEIYVLNPNLKFDPRYTGQSYDVETGLYYYKSRYYNPAIARFIQPDTVTPDAKDLQAYNKYSYVMNNPLKYTDPSGHGLFWKIFGAFIAALVAVLVSILTYGTMTVPMMTAAQAFWAGVGAAVVGGMAGGLVGGAIAGGLTGAISGMLFGFAGGMVFGPAGVALNGAIGFWGTFAIMAGVGAGLSYATGGWKGLVTFGAGVLGALSGKGLLGAMQNRQAGYDTESESEDISGIRVRGSDGKLYADARSPIQRPDVGLPGGASGGGTRALSPYRYTRPGETYQHYGSAENAGSLESGLRPGSYGTTAEGLSGIEAQRGLALPQTNPPNAVYKISPPPGTLIRVNPTIRPQFGQPGGLPEVEFITGTPPGSVSGPSEIP